AFLNMMFSIWVSSYPTALRKKIMMSGNGLDEKGLGKRSSCPIIDQSVPYISRSSLSGKRSLNALMHSRIFLLGPTLRISPSELMFGIGVRVSGTGDDLPNRPFPAFVHVACRPAVLHGVVEM